MSNALLQKVISEFEKLPAEGQNAVAAYWLEELKDEQIWAEKFASTTDEQWDKLVSLAKRDMAEGDVSSLDDFLTKTT